MKNLILLHGALGTITQFKELINVIKGRYSIHTFNFTGHGGAEMPSKFGIELFSEQLNRYIKERNLTDVNIFGYSMGGYVGLYSSLNNSCIKSVITLATKFDWNEETAAKETKMLNPEVMEQKVPQYVDLLKKIHEPSDWKILVSKTTDMMLDLGRNQPLNPAVLNKISIPTLLMVGDRDKMVSISETYATYKITHGSQLAVLPNTAHPIESCDNRQIAFQIENFVGD